MSNNGYIVFRNRSLLAAFAPTEPTQDYGLDALFVVTDTQPSRPCPRIIGQTSFGNQIHLEWDGDGEVFQFKHATSPGGPWVPCTEVLADLSCDIDTDVTANTVHFYRLRQW